MLTGTSPDPFTGKKISNTIYVGLDNKYYFMAINSYDYPAAVIGKYDAKLFVLHTENRNVA